MIKIATVLFLALFIGTGAIFQKFSFDGRGHAPYDSRVPTAFMELGKLLLAYFYAFRERSSGEQASKIIKDIWVASPLKYVLKFGIPAFFYALSNNLSFLLLELEAPAEYVLLWNFKIVATTLLLALWLKRKFSFSQYIAIAGLVIGLGLTQISHFQNSNNNNGSHPSSNSSTTAHVVSPSRNRLGFENFFHVMLGPILTIFGAAFTAFTNVYCEQLYKQSDAPVRSEEFKYEDTFWMKNVRLYTFGFIMNMASFFVYELKQHKAENIFHGFNIWVVIIILQGCGSGLLVGITMTVLDNIAVVHADGIATIITTILSVIYFHFKLDLVFICGGAMIIGSIYLFHIKATDLPCFSQGVSYEAVGENEASSNANEGRLEDVRADGKPQKPFNDDEDSSTEETPLI